MYHATHHSVGLQTDTVNMNMNVLTTLTRPPLKAQKLGSESLNGWTTAAAPKMGAPS
jgi:hypothetical protein